MSSSVILDGPRARAGDAELVLCWLCEFGGFARLDHGAISLVADSSLQVAAHKS
jgi:hypothetical protein